MLGQAFFRGDVEGRPGVELVDKGSGRFQALVEDFRVARLYLLLLLRADRPVTQGRTVVGGALEDGQVGDLFGDGRNKLDGGGARSHHAYALAGQVDAFLRPVAGVTPLALEAVDTLEVGQVPR